MSIRWVLAFDHECAYSPVMTEHASPIPNRIKLAREARNVKAIDLSIALQVHPSQLWHWENKHAPRADIIAKIAEILDVDAGWIVTGNGRQPIKKEAANG